MNVVVLTGAGVSAESGLKTFRDAGGLWEGHSIEDVCTPQAFARNASLVYKFYNERRRQLQDSSVMPNEAHKAIAKYEHQHAGQFLLVTQNVDDLHERAGSRQLLHMHGELLSARCLRTGKVYHWRGDLDESSPHPDHPDRTGLLRPNIVWFGEMPLEMNRISAALSKCDLFVSIGTSGNVYPAAGFVQQTSSSCRTVEINLESTGISSDFDEHYLGMASIEVPKFFASLKA
jgi:NAD-dependent deacetylase